MPVLVLAMEPILLRSEFIRDKLLGEAMRTPGRSDWARTRAIVARGERSDAVLLSMLRLDGDGGLGRSKPAMLRSRRGGLATLAFEFVEYVDDVLDGLMRVLLVLLVGAVPPADEPDERSFSGGGVGGKI
jgi:hypothetical protein